ncbi:MAG: adenosylcobinamide-GDP ribazoletransferase [Dehalococcoidia bacterium]
MRFLGGSLIAIEFLTPLRIRAVRTYDDRTFAAALGWYPFAGLVIGAALALLDLVLRELLPAGPTAALLVVTLALLSGGLHLDGVADTADGLAVQAGGGEDGRARRLAVMREGTIGPAGVMALVLVLLTQWSALASLPEDARTAALLAAPAIARWTVVPVATTFPPARPGGLGHGIRDGLWPVAAPLATLIAIVVAAVTFGAAGVVLVAAGGFAALLVGGAAARLLGGVTGDVFGAAIEVSQVIVWLTVLALLQQGWAEPILRV